MKILLINQTFHPDLSATAQYLTDLALHLVQEGNEVSVLTGRQNYLIPHERYSAEEIYRGIRIIRVWSLPFDRKSKTARLLSAILLNLAFAWKLVWLSDFDRLIILTTPPMVGWIASLFAKWRRQPFVYWLMDINPDQAIQAGWIRRFGFGAWLAKRMLVSALRRSTKVVVLDKFMKENICSKGISSENVQIVPLWSPQEVLEDLPHEKNGFRTEYGLSGKFVVMYSGNLSICHPINTVLEAARLLQYDSSIQFVFIGGGPRLSEVLDYKNRHQLSNIACLPYQERQKLKSSLAAADVHVIAMGNPFIGVLHPSKIYGILGAGRPFIFIGPMKSAIGELIQETGLGRQIEHDDANGFVDALYEMKHLSLNERQQILRKSMEVANTRFNQKKLAAELAQL